MTGELNVSHIRRFVDEMVEVDDDAIRTALKMVLERSKLVAEPAAVVGIAPLVTGAIKLRTGTRAVVILSGGNLDLGSRRVVSGL